jgi:hypothetical protein
MKDEKATVHPSSFILHPSPGKCPRREVRRKLAVSYQPSAISQANRFLHG